MRYLPARSVGDKFGCDGDSIHGVAVESGVEDALCGSLELLDNICVILQIIEVESFLELAISDINTFHQEARELFLGVSDLIHIRDDTAFHTELSA